MMNMTTKRLSAMFLSAAVCAAPALAQQQNEDWQDNRQQRSSQNDRQSNDRQSNDRQSDDRQSDDRQSNDRQSDDRQSDDRQSDDRQSNDRQSGYQSNSENQQNRSSNNQSANRRQVKIDPRGWVSMAIDYNNDGIYDGVETIYVYDLEKARRTSRSRKSDGNQGSSRMSRSGDGQGEMSSDRNRSNSGDSRQSQMMTVSGTIDSMHSDKMAGMNKRHQFAKIDTQDKKRLAVCLGTEEELSKLNLSEGDRLEVQGKKARINDRTVLMATKVTHDGQSVSLKSPQKSKTKRVKAEVKETRTANFRNIDQPHLIARVTTNSGKTETVNMGPKSKFADANIKKGTQVKLLVRQGRVNGQDALIAQEVNTNGKTIKLPRPQDRKRFMGGQQANQNRDQNGNRDRNRYER